MFGIHKIKRFFLYKKDPYIETKTPDSSFKIPLVSPKGLYSKGEGEACLSMISGMQTFALPLQKHIDLKKGDVILTDDKNHIHFQYKDGKIEIKGDTIFNDNVTIKGNLEVEGDIKVKGDVEGQNMKAKNKVEAVNVEATADVAAGAIKLTQHTHPYSGNTITTGDAFTGVTLPPTP